ncbi:MAG: hypothetical protein A3J72_08540 [Nitrospirae bacterium RIFCSPHIGHO2_02_FULL_40_19]|nr:MAG: hypothetical protein A3J72_08540 [Nitrospirae bacterium RIFCSPHIGHO2_02_FULL_40_19]
MLTRILHLSDLHIGKSKEEDNNFDLIVKYILDKGNNDWLQNKPLIIITGDIVDDGEERQFKAARDYLNKLHGAGFTLRIIPGNHDYGENGNAAKIENFVTFKKYFGYFHEMKFPFREKEFINGHSFVGLNSMAEYTEVNFAKGKLGAAQIEETCAFLNGLTDRHEKQKVIVYLHHHPFLFPDEGVLKKIGENVGLRLEDGSHFMKEIKNQRVDILLFGHEHRHLKFSGTELNKVFSTPYILSSGKSTETNWEYNVLEDGTADTPPPTIIADVSDDPYIEDYDDLEAKIREKDLEKRKGLPNGLFGRLIEINDDGGIDIVTINFS